MSKDKDQNKKVTFVAIGTACLMAVAGVGAAVYALTLEPANDGDLAAHTTESTHAHNEGDGHSHGSDDKKASAPSAKQASAVIVYGDNGFEQTSFSVKAGDTVRVENQSSVDFYFTTGDHHNHDIHSPLNLGTIQPGEASSFVAPAAGTYGFHNHDDETEAGEIIVQ